MLVVRGEHRIHSEDLVTRLGLMKERALKDMLYAVGPTAQPLTRSVEPPLPVKVDVSEKAGILEKAMAMKISKLSCAVSLY